jgi:hypothetical protein
VRIDELNALRESVDLGPANVAIERRQLAVDIRETNVVQIDQGDPANPGARQPFNDPRTDPAYAHDTDVRSL